MDILIIKFLVGFSDIYSFLFKNSRSIAEFEILHLSFLLMFFVCEPTAMIHTLNESL